MGKKKNTDSHNQLMQAFLATYCHERLVHAAAVTVADTYDGDPYGDHVPFAVGSNQTIVTRDDPRYDACAALARDDDRRPDFDYTCECGYYVCEDCDAVYYPMEAEPDPDTGTPGCMECGGRLRTNWKE